MRRLFSTIIIAVFVSSIIYGNFFRKTTDDKFSVFQFEKFITENGFVVQLTVEQLEEYDLAAKKSIELFSEGWANKNLIAPIINPTHTGNLTWLPKRGYIVDDQKLLRSFFTPQKYKSFVTENVGPGGITISCANAFFINHSPIEKYAHEFETKFGDLDIFKNMKPSKNSSFSYLLTAMINETEHLYIGAYLPEQFGKLTYMDENEKNLLFEATKDFTLGNYESAIDKFLQVRNKCPALANAINLAALSERRLGNYKSSSELYNVAITVREKELDSRMNHLLNQFDLGNFREIANILDGIQKYVGETPSYYFWKAIYEINTNSGINDTHELLGLSAKYHYENNNDLGIQSDLVLIGYALWMELSKSEPTIGDVFNDSKVISSIRRIKEYCENRENTDSYYGKMCQIDNPQNFIQKAISTYSGFYRNR